jgi:hypothetical protein
MKVLTRYEAVVLASVLAASCASSEVAPVASSRPARPENCPVQLFPTTRPPFPSVDLQSVQVVCNRALGLAACIDKLRSKSCALGGDAAYGFKEGINPDGAGMLVSATVAVRGEPSPSRSSTGTVAPADDASGPSCAPICSPGFACEAGQCLPQCNPACEPTEICNRHRTCQPAAAVPASAK